jgi:microcystin-dependent protein
MLAPFFRSWLPRTFARQTRRGSRAHQARKCRLALECLEERTVMDSTGIVGKGLPINAAPAALPVHYMIALQGLYPTPNTTTSGAGLDPMLGEVRLFAGTQAPSGWAFCDGQALSITEDPALFNLLGTTYGGDGYATFDLPDLRARGAVGTGQITGLPNQVGGQRSGADTFTLSLGQEPNHQARLAANGFTGSAGEDQILTVTMPTLGMNYIIAVGGAFQELGEIRLFAGNFAPGGWAFCDGQALSIAQYQPLFTVLGSTYGGDGHSTFNLPNLQGRLPRGTGPNTIPADQNAPFGFQLGANQLPVHNYPLPSGGTTGNIGGGQAFENPEPYFGLNYIIALQGAYQAVGSNSPALGQITPFAGTVAPAGWAFCDGQVLSIAQNQALFSILGTTYGGDGISTFALPDLRDRIAVEAGGSGNLMPRALGVPYGSNEITISTDNLPPESLELPNVTTTVTAMQATVAAGSVADFTITFQATASSAVAGDVTLTDALPDLGNGQTWSIKTPSGNPAATPFQIVTVDNVEELQLKVGSVFLFPGSSFSVEVVGSTAPSTSPFSAAITDTATSDSPDETVRNQSASDTVTVLSPDVAVSNVADAVSIPSGAPAGFTINLSNIGLGQANGLTFSDPLPALGGNQLWSIDPASPSAADFSITGAAGSQQLTLNGVSSLASDGTLSVHVTGTATAVGTLNNTVTASAANEAISLQNNQASASELVTAPPTTVTSINRVGSAIVNPGSGTVSWSVTFADAVGGLGAGDFTLASNGPGGTPAITSVTPIGGTPAAVWAVTASTGTGDGALQLMLTSEAGLDHTVSNLPASGDVITLDRTAPMVTIAAPSQSIARTGDAVTFTVTYTDANFGSSTLTASDVTLANSGATGDTATGVVQSITGTGNTRTITIGSLGGNGTLQISIAAGTAIDLAGNLAPAAGPSTAFTIDNLALGSASLTLPQWTVNQAGYSVTIPISNGFGPFTVVTQSGLPAGLTATVTGASVTFNGTPTVAGVFSNLQITVQDSNGVTASRTFSITINAALAVSNPTTSAWTQGKSGFTGTMTVSNGTAPYSIVGAPAGVPTGMVLQLSGNSISFTGTPTVKGAYSGSVTVQDVTGAKVVKNFTITINPAISITPSALAPYIIGHHYSETVSLSGGTGPIKLYVSLSAPLPAGLTLKYSPNGESFTISGRPRRLGVVTITVRAIDSVGAESDFTYTLTGRRGRGGRGR